MGLPEDVKFSEDEEKFLKSEFGLTVEQVFAMSEDELDNLYDNCCQIEIDEACTAIDDGDRELSERGKSAVRLVDLIHGPYDSTEFDAEMAEEDVEE
jgi:hypothetical protein